MAGTIHPCLDIPTAGVFGTEMLAGQSYLPVNPAVSVQGPSVAFELHDG